VDWGFFASWQRAHRDSGGSGRCCTVVDLSYSGFKPAALCADPDVVSRHASVTQIGDANDRPGLFWVGQFGLLRREGCAMARWFNALGFSCCDRSCFTATLVFLAHSSTRSSIAWRSVFEMRHHHVVGGRHALLTTGTNYQQSLSNSTFCEPC